jgi:hypothetical protein
VCQVTTMPPFLYSGRLGKACFVEISLVMWSCAAFCGWGRWQVPRLPHEPHAEPAATAPTASPGGSVLGTLVTA